MTEVKRNEITALWGYEYCNLKTLFCQNEYNQINLHLLLSKIASRCLKLTLCLYGCLKFVVFTKTK